MFIKCEKRFEAYRCLHGAIMIKMVAVGEITFGLLMLVSAIHCQQPPVPTPCNEVPGLPFCPNIIHIENATVAEAWFVREGKRVPGEPAIGGIGGSRRYNETVSADMNGTMIQCKAVLRLSDGSNHTHIFPAYIIEVTTECPVSTTVERPTDTSTTPSPIIAPRITESASSTAITTLDAAGNSDGVAVGVTISVLLVVVVSFVGSLLLYYWRKPISGLISKWKKNFKPKTVTMEYGDPCEDRKNSGVADESTHHLDEDTYLLRTAPPADPADTSISSPSQASENLQKFSSELAPNGDDPIVEAESTPATTPATSHESSHTTQCVDSIKRLQSSSSSVVVSFGRPALPSSLPKSGTATKCVPEGSAEVDGRKTTPTSGAACVPESSAEGGDPKAAPTSSAGEDCPNTPKTPVQESSSAQPTPSEKKEFVFPGVKVPPAQLSLGSKTTSVFSTALEEAPNLNVQEDKQ